MWLCLYTAPVIRKLYSSKEDRRRLKTTFKNLSFSPMSMLNCWSGPLEEEKQTRRIDDMAIKGSK